MDIDTMRSVITVVSFLTFIGIVLWAYSGARKARFEEAARLPFDEEDFPAGEQRR